MQVEHGTFTPPVASLTRGMGRESPKFYSRLAELISKKKETKYCAATGIQRKLCFH